MSEICKDCGVVGCEERFYRLLALEFADAEYGAVHHLTVAAYMLQHPSRLSLEGWRAMHGTLRAFLVEQRTPRKYRAQMGRQMDSGKRSWSLTKGPRMALPDGFVWSETITAVDDGLANVYRRGIEAWARHVLSDAERLLGE